MYSMKDRDIPTKGLPVQSILAAKRRRQLYPFFFHMGPVALSVTSVLLIGLMAILYLSQVGQAVAANQQLQTINYQQATLQRQDEDLALNIATEQSPGYIAQQAQRLGLVPVDPRNVQILVVQHMQTIPTHDQSVRP